MISLGTVALLQHPEQLQRLRESDDPAVTANAVEELMRYLTIVHSQVDRVALEDLVINGQRISAGDDVLMILPAGSWDPAFIQRPTCSISTEIRADTWVSASARTSASDRTWPASSCRSRSPHWCVDCRDCA